MGAAPPTMGPQFEDEINLLEVLNVFLKRWRTVVGVPLGAAGVVFGISFLVPPTYTATASFVPEARSQARAGGLAGLAGLAGQFGIALGGEPSQSPRFYADVAKSRDIIDRLLLARYPDPRVRQQPGDSATCP